MDGELPAVPLVAVCDREAHHPGTRFEVGHTSAQPMVDRAATDVEAPGDLPLAYPSAPRGITWMSWLAGQGGSRGIPQLAERDRNQGGIESSGFFHVGMFNGFRSRLHGAMEWRGSCARFRPMPALATRLMTGSFARFFAVPFSVSGSLVCGDFVQ